MSAFVNHSPSISVISCETLSVIALHFFTSLSSVTRSRKARRQKYYRGSSSSVLPLNHVLCCTLLWHEFQTTEEHPQNYQNHFFEFQSIVQQTSPDCSQPSRRSSRVLGGPPLNATSHGIPVVTEIEATILLPLENPVRTAVDGLLGGTDRWRRGRNIQHRILILLILSGSFAGC